MNKEELHRRAVKAAAESILRRGYEVIDTDWESVCGGHIDDLQAPRDKPEGLFLRLPPPFHLPHLLPHIRLRSLGLPSEGDPVASPTAPAMESSLTGL